MNVLAANPIVRKLIKYTRLTLNLTRVAIHLTYVPILLYLGLTSSIPLQQMPLFGVPPQPGLRPNLKNVFIPVISDPNMKRLASMQNRGPMSR
jgi:hypothetical protein